MVKRPGDETRISKTAVEADIERTSNPASAAKRDPQVRGNAGGLRGVEVRPAMLSEERRKSIAVNAVETRRRGKAKS